MAQDPEIEAMSSLAEALDPLDEETRSRVLEWAGQRFGGAKRVAGLGKRDGDGSSEAPGDVMTGFTSFVDLFDATTPRTDPERALVGAYWFQVVGGASDFPSQQVNEALKDVGHGVGNITDALSKLQRRKPALVRQVAKSGRTRQARKRYKITTAGIAAVQGMTRRFEED
jgi:hypothetical protein